MAEFTSRPLPTEKEVERFEEFIEEEARGEEIEESLSEIYQDDNGEMVDVKSMTIKKRHGFLFWFFMFIFFMVMLSGAGYAAYNYIYLRAGSDATAVELSIDGKTDITAGEDLAYTVYYKNTSNIPLRNARLNIAYPDNFFFSESQPAPASKNGIWLIDSIPAKYSGKIVIKGTMIGPKDESGVILADLTYVPENFSSEFKKEASFSSTIRDIGLSLNFNYASTALLGEENEVDLEITGKETDYIHDFRLVFEPQDNIEFTGGQAGNDAPDFTLIRPGVWQVNNITSETRVLPIRFKFTDKISDRQEVTVDFYKSVQDAAASSTESRQIGIFSQKLKFEVMKSDLNLTLILNGSRNDQPVDFGQTLNYSIVYKNAGEADMKNVVIMAVLDSDFLDWTTLRDANKGREKGNTISWSKEEIPALAVIARNAEGMIDFSIDVAGLGEPDFTKDYQVKSYAQFSVGAGSATGTPPDNADNKSNTIVSKVNSDLKLAEQVRYFNTDNIPVGTGPQPPQAGQTTSYKVYWDLSNNLHELNDLKATMKLPDYVSWNGKERASVGSVQYAADTNEVTWNIGRLPITVYKANAEFSISITPTDDDKNKIIVLTPGSSVEATDIVTGEQISQTTKAKTTKLEDDDIAGGDGIVR